MGGPPLPPHSIPPWSAFFSLSFSLTLYLPPYPSIYRYIYLSSCPSMYVFIYLSLDLSIYLSTYWSIYLSICLSIKVAIDLSIYRSMLLSLYLFIHLFIYLFIVLSIYLSIDVLIYRSIVDVLVPLRPCRGIETRNVYVPHMRALARARGEAPACRMVHARARRARAREVTLHLTLCFWFYSHKAFWGANIFFCRRFEWREVSISVWQYFSCCSLLPPYLSSPLSSV